jgi:hypothetical protein
MQRQLRSKLGGDTLMKYWYCALALTVFLVAVGCGAGHANLTSITVTPQSATTTLQGQVGFTAMGNFSDHTSRELTRADGLSWRTSTAGASVGASGEATCLGPGTVTVTASAPENLQLTINNGVQNTAPTIRGNGTLICQ